jgi:hypothetical protein
MATDFVRKNPYGLLAGAFVLCVLSYLIFWGRSSKATDTKLVSGKSNEASNVSIRRTVNGRVVQQTGKFAKKSSNRSSNNKARYLLSVDGLFDGAFATSGTILSFLCLGLYYCGNYYRSYMYQEVNFWPWVFGLFSEQPAKVYGSRKELLMSFTKAIIASCVFVGVDIGYTQAGLEQELMLFTKDGALEPMYQAFFFTASLVTLVAAFFYKEALAGKDLVFASVSEIFNGPPTVSWGQSFKNLLESTHNFFCSGTTLFGLLSEAWPAYILRTVLCGGWGVLAKVLPAGFNYFANPWVMGVYYVGWVANVVLAPWLFGNHARKVNAGF